MWESQWSLPLAALGLVAVVALAVILKGLWARRRPSELIEALKREELDAELELLLRVWPRDPKTAAYVYTRAYRRVVIRVIRRRSSLKTLGQSPLPSFDAIRDDFWNCVRSLEAKWRDSGASVPERWRSCLEAKIGGERHSLKRVVDLHARGYWGF